MDKKRQQLAREFWDRSNILSMDNEKYSSYIKNFIKEKLDEDIGNGDITTDALIGKDKEISAYVIAREEGIAAGIDEISSMFKSVKPVKKDGDKVKNGDIILEISNNARKILASERVILNILQRMSGIATTTHNTIKLTDNQCLVAATRKTLMPLLDKKAVSIGGGLTHRLNLNDAAMIKDNHLEVLGNGVEKAISDVIAKTATGYIEIEVRNEEEAFKAAEAISKTNSKRSFAIMFDNMIPEKIKNSMSRIKKTDNILFEASGGITGDNIREYCSTGVDIISLGFITHSPRVLNMSLVIR
jgi:nicotinate-nucleotide pyrophosphorylase (carboxylating)